MQNDPEKHVGNYNEFRGMQPVTAPHEGFIKVVQDEELGAGGPEQVVDKGLELVNAKIDEILGSNNKLTGEDLSFPEVQFVATLPKYPNWAGYFSPSENRIVIVADKIKDQLSQTKVFIHEYIHFLSHNGRDEAEQLGQASPIAQHNNVGFSRFFGLDIREGNEGKITSDYFLSFNEAVTELLARDILPNVHETYGDYLGLLNQVIDDALEQGIGSMNESGTFSAWSREQFKSYIYTSFLRGNLAGFSNLLQNIYKEYDISEQQFGLMTHKDDLPSVIEKTISEIGGPPPSPSNVAMRVQKRLNSKTRDDYITDIIDLDPADDDGRAKYGAEYDAHIKKYAVTYSHKEILSGREYDFDSHGYIIYRGEDAAVLFEIIKAELDDLLSQKVDAAEIAGLMDERLFDGYGISMLSDGFRDFYIYKHAKIDKL